MRSREERREDRQERREDRREGFSNFVDGVGGFLDGTQQFVGDVVGGVANAALDMSGLGVVMDTIIPGSSDAVAGIVESVVTAPFDMPVDFVQTALGPAFGGDGGTPPPPPSLPSYPPVTPGSAETGATAVYQNNPTDANYQAMLDGMQQNMAYQMGPNNVPPPSAFPMPPVNQPTAGGPVAGGQSNQAPSAGGSGASGSVPPLPPGMTQQQADDLCSGMFPFGGPPPVGAPPPPPGTSSNCIPAWRCYDLRRQASQWLRDQGCPSRVVPIDYYPKRPPKRPYGGGSSSSNKRRC